MFLPFAQMHAAMLARNTGPRMAHSSFGGCMLSKAFLGLSAGNSIMSGRSQ